GSQHHRVAALVRSRHDRPLANQDRTLWQEVARQPVAAALSVRVGRKGDQPSRIAQLQIRFCSVWLKPPSRQADAAALQVWAIEAREAGPVPKGAARIVWQLVSTLPVTCAQEAIEKVRWYAQRWQIEV